jgi:hypothetical protein
VSLCARACKRRVGRWIGGPGGRFLSMFSHFLRIAFANLNVGQRINSICVTLTLIYNRFHETNRIRCRVTVDCLFT